MSAAELAMELPHMRRDLRGLVALEWIQMTLAFAALIAVGVRAALTARNHLVAASFAAAILLALLFIVLALRIRIGAGALRGDLEKMAIRAEVERSTEAALRGHPYRSNALCSAPRTVRGWRRRHLGLLLYTGLALLMMTSEAIAMHDVFASASLEEDDDLEWLVPGDEDEHGSGLEMEWPLNKLRAVRDCMARSSYDHR